MAQRKVLILSPELVDGAKDAACRSKARLFFAAATAGTQRGRVPSLALVPRLRGEGGVGGGVGANSAPAANPP
jgi:hypothetical protein